jgi:hypothetical protein
VCPAWASRGTSQWADVNIAKFNVYVNIGIHFFFLKTHFWTFFTHVYVVSKKC